jgi:hypothetical protein
MGSRSENAVPESSGSGDMLDGKAVLGDSVLHGMRVAYTPTSRLQRRVFTGLDRE